MALARCACWSRRSLMLAQTLKEVDPHLLTKARIELSQKGMLLSTKAGTTQWHRLANSDDAFVNARFDELHKLHMLTERREFTDRMGDTAEIAVMKAMQQNRLSFVGHFADLDKHEDNRRYEKHMRASAKLGHSAPRKRGAA